MEIYQPAKTEVNPKPTKSKGKKTPKGGRKANPEAWKVNVRKAAIQHGKSYTRDDGTIAPAKTVGEFCKNCRLKCPDRISHEIRQQFFDRYYNIASLSEKRQFLLRYVQTFDVKRRRGASADNSVRKFSRNYYIGTGCWENGTESKIQVCQVTFLNTLSISTKVFRSAYDRMRSTNGTSFEDLRGRFLRKTISSDDVTETQIAVVKDYIKTFPLVDDFIPRMYDLYFDHMKKARAKPELYVSIEQYKSIYDQALEEKRNPKLKKKEVKKTTTQKPPKTVEIIEVKNISYETSPNIMTLEQYNASIGHQQPYYERTWMGGFNNTETKVGYVSYQQEPLVKVEIDTDMPGNQQKTTKETKKKAKKRKANEDPDKQPTKKSHNKKGWSDPKTSAANRRKNANLHGLSYTKRDGTIKPAKALKEFCQNCRLNCEAKIDDALRQQFFDRYYLLSSLNEKYQFILRYTQTTDIKRSRGQTENSRRKITRMHYIGTGFWENGSETRIQVCKTLFLNTLCISDKIVRTAYEKLWSTNGTSFEDKRGVYLREKKEKAKTVTVKKTKKSQEEENDMREEVFSAAQILSNL